MWLRLGERSVQNLLQGGNEGLIALPRSRADPHAKRHIIARLRPQQEAALMQLPIEVLGWYRRFKHDEIGGR